jgi:hypothetical protein
MKNQRNQVLSDNNKRTNISKTVIVGMAILIVSVYFMGKK